MRKERAAWVERLSSIAGMTVEVGNVTAAAVLVIRDGEGGDGGDGGDASAFALTYGMGFQLLDPASVDPGFGMRVAIRTASPEEIQSLTRTELDHRSKTDRSSIPAGDVLRGFGIGDFGEIITRLSGTAQLPGLAVEDKSIRVRAADALSLPLGKTPQTLISDLKAISSALKLEAKPELRALEQFVRVKRPDLIEELESELRSALADKNSGRLALGWPHERIDDNGTPSSYKLIGTGKRGVAAADDLPTLDEVVNALKAKMPDNPLAAASSIKVQLFRDADGEEPICAEIPAKHWLFFEVNLDDIRYCFLDSRWYAMDTDYAQRLQVHVNEIFARPAPIQMPAWNVNQCPDESAYNEVAASAIGGLMLDRQLITTGQHPRGFEACDIITPSGDFIHVKHTPKSSAASHLVAQAAVSTDALRHDNEARTKLRELILSAGGDESWDQARLKSVVLGMARGEPVTPSDLFSFTQVTVTRLDASLAEAGINLTIAPIQRVSGD